jgi:hypothetical protein
MATISQRISLEGSEDIRRQLEQLGQAGEKAFKQIRDAAAKPLADPAQINKAKQALDQLVVTTAKLGPQFQAISTAAQRAGTAIAGAAEQSRAVSQTAGTGLISAATAFKIAAVGIVASIAAVTDALVKGTVESGTAIAESAEKLKLNIAQWMRLRSAISDTGTSMDAVQGATSNIMDLLDKAQGGIQRFANGMTQQAFKVGESTIVITKWGQAASVVKTEADRAATALGRMGITVEDIAKGDPVILLRNLAQSISDIGDAGKQKAAGLAAFGEKWKEIVEVLRSGREVLGDANKSLADFGRQNRGLSGADIGKVIQLKAAWRDLSLAIRATRDLIGTVFLDAAFTRARWLTTLIDGSTELLRRWLQLSDLAQRGAFLRGLGDTGAEQLFKIYIALGEQLAGLWRDVLVPAGEALLEIFGGISSNFEDVTKSQVAAFFISAAIAAAGLAIALKGISLVLGPIATLLSFAFSPLGIILIAAAAAAALFWDKLKEGATSVLALIPQEVAQVQQALQLLFKGDFAGAWKTFSQAAVTAFNTIKQAFLSTQIGQEILGIVRSLVSAFNGLKTAATTTATAINKVFGTELTGSGIAAIFLVGQMSGVLQGLASVAVIAGVAFGGIVRTLGLFATAVGGLPLALGLIGIALTGLIVYIDPTIWDRWKESATNAVNAIKGLIASLTPALGGVGSNLNPLVWDIFAQAALIGINTIMRAVNGLTLVINGLTMAIEATKRAWGSMQSMQAPSAPLPEPGGTPMARGGLFGGRGTGTSDSNLAWVSRGEHIMPARAVRQPGVLAFLEALRRTGGDLSRLLDGMGRFALGGMVPRGVIPAFANGGPVGRMSNVTIQFPGVPPIAGLRASSNVVEQLHKAAALAQVRSGGRKPSRYS